jgi:hydrogenase-1 operon protein HyaF
MTQNSLPHARPIPAGAVGPGSQPDEIDGAELDYLAMPGEMQTYRQPPLPEPEEIAGLAAGIWQLRALQHLLGGYCIGALPQVMDLRALDAANLRLVEDSLGEGEVSIRCGDLCEPGAGQTTAQETRLAGVWRVRVIGDDGRLDRDVLEISDVPGFVRDAAFSGARSAIALPDSLPEGVMNAPGVLAELNDHVAKRLRDDDAPAHIINLTLLPQSEQDLAFLGERLGAGCLSILSRGYGNCRITSTGLRDVWWVQFYNSDDKLILNTLEVTDVPAAALAAQEDIDDSATRLREILNALQ